MQLTLLASSLFWVSQVAFSGEMTPQELTRRIDRLYRMDASEAEITMKIQTPDWERELKIKSWAEGMDKTLMRILAPAKDRGVATLRVGKEMWNYFPKINKVMKIPPSMMMGSWMGSDFTNDDLVRQTSLEEEYDSSLVTEGENYILTLVPKKNTATVWGKIVSRVRKSDLLPVDQTFFDEKGEKVRIMEFSDVKDFGKIKLPSTMKLTPLKKPGNSTTVRYDSLRPRDKIEASMFTLRALQERS
jgi:outer membrane lipoprotein-sorting protein